MPTTLTDRRPPTDEYRVAAYLSRWPLLTHDEAVAELAAMDAAVRAGAHRLPTVAGAAGVRPGAGAAGGSA